MDEFASSARQLRMRNVLYIGATFGIFLTIGNAWSMFLQAAVFRIMPSETPVVINGVTMDDINLLRELLFAALCTLICVLLLCCLVKTNQCMDTTERVVHNPHNIRRVARAFGVRIVQKPR